jgi:hypothetical protein
LAKRGLSHLQKTILLFISDQGGFASSREILSRVWGPSLRPEETGYASAHASLSRSLSRLWQRGLIDIFKKLSGSGTSTSATIIGLTPTGKEMARFIVEKSG